MIRRGQPIFVDDHGKYHAELLDDCLPASELKEARMKNAAASKGVKKKREWKPRDDLEKRVMECMETDPSGHSCDGMDIQKLHRSRDCGFVGRGRGLRSSIFLFAWSVHVPFHWDFLRNVSLGERMRRRIADVRAVIKVYAHRVSLSLTCAIVFVHIILLNGWV